MIIMRIAKIGELKAKLSAHIEYVKGGNEVLILDRNTPVARLVAVEPVRSYDARTRRLIARGVLSLPSKPRKLGKKWPGPVGNARISRQVMDKIWKEELADRC